MGSESEDFLRAVLSAVPAFVAKLDVTPDFPIRYLNRFGPDVEERDVIGTSMFSFIDPAYESEVRAALHRAVETGETGRFDTVVRTVAGERRYYENHVAPLRHDGRVEALTIVATDATDERERRRALELARASVELAVEATDIGLWILDLRTGEIEWSPRMCEITGQREPLDADAFREKVIRPDFHDQAQRDSETVMREGAMRGETCLLVNGEERWVKYGGRIVTDDTGAPVRMVGAMVDISEQRRMSQQLSRAERLRLIGELTAGVAHNFNNVLMALTPILELIKADGDTNTAQLAEQGLGVTGRAATIVGQLMAVAGKNRASDPEPINVLVTIDECVQICRRMFPGNVEVGVVEPSFDQLGPSPAMAHADEDRVSQVLMNLLLNARDAVVSSMAPSRERENTAENAGEGNVGRVQVSVALSERDGRAWVDIAVTDNGAGVPVDLAPQLFEPFVTSKGAHGTGLGLASCAAIARQLEGRIWYEAPEQGGARFVFSLPAASPDVVVPVPRHQSEATKVSRLEGRRVLMVEDEPVIRESIATVLRRRGADVVATASVPATLTWLEQGEHEIDVVLLDRSLPGESGVELVPKLRAELPSAAILFFTGEPVPDSDLASVDGIISKPVRTRELVRRLGEVLQAGRAAE